MSVFLSLDVGSSFWYHSPSMKAMNINDRSKICSIIQYNTLYKPVQKLLLNPKKCQNASIAWCFSAGENHKRKLTLLEISTLFEPLNVRQSNLKSKSINTLKSRILKWVCLVCLKIESTSHRWPFFLTNTRMNVPHRQRWAMFMPSKNSPCPGLVQGRQIARINYNKLVDCCQKMCVASAIWTYLEFIYAHRWS